MSIVKDSTYLLISQIVCFLFGVIDSIIISRVLGPSDRGIYDLAKLANEVVVNFGNMGVGFTNIYLISKRKRNVRGIHSNSIFIALFITGLTFLLYWITKDYLHSNVLKGVNPLFTLVGIGLVPVTLYGLYWSLIMAGLKKFELMSKLNICLSIIGTVNYRDSYAINYPFGLKTRD